MRRNSVILTNVTNFGPNKLFLRRRELSLKRFGSTMLVSAAILVLGATAAFGATFQEVDQNGDGVICFKVVPNGNMLQKDNHSGTATGCPRGYDVMSNRGGQTIFCDGEDECTMLHDLCASAGGFYEEFIGEKGVEGQCQDIPSPLVCVGAVACGVLREFCIKAAGEFKETVYPSGNAVGECRLPSTPTPP